MPGSDTKSLIDEYALESQMLRAALAEREAAIVMLTAHYGTPAKRGKLLRLAVPASARRAAKRLSGVDLIWPAAGGDWTKGALRIDATIAEVTKDD